MAEDNDRGQTDPLQRKISKEASGCLLCVVFTTLTLFCANRGLWVGWLLAIPAVYFFRVWLEEVCPQAVRVIRVVLLALLGTTIVACAVRLVLFPPMVPSNWSLPDSTNIKNLELAVRMYQQCQGCLPAVASDVEGEQPNAFVVGLLKDTAIRDGPYLELDDRDLEDGARVDSWGKPLHIVIDTNGDGWVPVGTDKVNKQVAVWSSGKNGINEFGQGDDLRNW